MYEIERFSVSRHGRAVRAVECVHALSGYRSLGRSLWRDTPMKQARPVCR